MSLIRTNNRPGQTFGFAFPRILPMMGDVNDDDDVDDDGGVNAADDDANSGG